MISFACAWPTSVSRVSLELHVNSPTFDWLSPCLINQTIGISLIYPPTKQVNKLVQHNSIMQISSGTLVEPFQAHTSWSDTIDDLHFRACSTNNARCVF